jgi:hypothetical protein
MSTVIDEVEVHSVADVRWPARSTTLLEPVAARAPGSMRRRR